MYLKYFIATTFGIFLGISLAYPLKFSTEIFLVSLVICFINFLIFKFSKKNFINKRSETPLTLSILFLFIAFGILLGQISLAKELSQKEKFTAFISQNDSYLGIIYKIKIGENSQQNFLNIKSREEGEKKETKGQKEKFKIKLTTQKIPEYRVGQILKVTGKIETEKIILPKIESVLNKSYSTESQNTLQDVDGELSFPKIETLEKSEFQVSFLEKVFYKLQNLKRNFVKTLDTLLPRSASALSAGIVLGDDSLFSKSDLKNFRVSGLSHIIVLSGFNITILISFLFFIFLNLQLKLKYRVFLSIFFIIIFIIFVGASPSLVRAGIMGSALLLTFLLGRQYVAKQTLFLAALFMMLITPKIAVYDISFHLSFLATFGILYLLPIFDEYKFFKKYNFEEEKLNFRKKILKNIFEIFKITLAAQVLVLPYIAFRFGTISIFGFLANILVLPFVPLIMFLALLIIFFSFFLPFISVWLGYLSFVFCKYIFIITENISSFSILEIEKTISVFEMLIFYLLIIFYIYFEKKRILIKKSLEENL